MYWERFNKLKKILLENVLHHCLTTGVVLFISPLCSGSLKRNDRVNSRILREITDCSLMTETSERLKIKAVIECNEICHFVSILSFHRYSCYVSSCIRIVIKESHIHCDFSTTQFINSLLHYKTNHW